MSTSNPSANDKNIVFRNEQHATNIYEKQLSFYKNSELFDINLIVGKNHVSIPAHKIVLSALSDYFSEKLRGKRKSYHESKDIDATALKLIIDFMYSGVIELNLENAESILRTAVFLKMQILVDGCCDFIENHIDTNNCLKYLSLSIELSLSALKDKCLKHINNHFEVISKQRELLLLNEIIMEDLLANANPEEESHFEEYIFLAIVAWIEHDNVNRKHLAAHLLSRVQYRLLTPKFILKNWSPVGKTKESAELVYSWLRMLSDAGSNEKQNNDVRPKNSHIDIETQTSKEDVQIPIISCTSSQEAVAQVSTHTTFDAAPNEAKTEIENSITNSSKSEDIRTSTSSSQQLNDQEISDSAINDPVF